MLTKNYAQEATSPYNDVTYHQEVKITKTNTCMKTIQKESFKACGHTNMLNTFNSLISALIIFTK